MTAELEELTRVASELPPEIMRKVIDYALKLSKPTPMEYDMDEPSEDELRRERNRAMQRFEDEHPGEDWGDLKPMKPGENCK